MKSDELPELQGQVRVIASVGGDVLHIEATRYLGKGNITFTGPMVEVMAESIEGIAPHAFKNTDIHAPVPSGAVTKDGPSARIATANADIVARAAQFSGTGLPLVLLVTLGLLVSGCSFLLPTSQGTVKSKWQSFDEAKVAFDLVVPGETTINQLAGLGFDPAANPNVRILTYLDVIQRFMPNDSITKQDLDPSVRTFIERREAGQAWAIEVNHTKAKRYGNALLDVTGFVKKTHETGWQFNGLVLILEGQVVYKLSSGQPSVDRYDKKVRPLGPLQELDTIIARTVGALTGF